MFYNIRMSLYEQFHSDINKKFMFDMIKNIIHKEINFDISLDSENYTQFLSTFEKTFNENDVEEIEQMNKVLLDNNIKLFLEKLKKPDPKMQNDLEKLLKERENQDSFTNVSTINNEGNEMSNGVSNEMRNEMGNEVKNEIKKFKKVKKIKKQEVEVEEKRNPQKINSSQRTNINSSRYNYKIDLMKQSISSNELDSISRLIIPIEDNYLFTIPVLRIIIPELDCDIHMQQEETIQGNHRKYGVYRCIEEHHLLKDIIDRITINIQDISGQKYYGSDILKVNIIEVKKNKIYFTCSTINSLDYQISDYIKIINNNTSTLFQVLQDPLKIKKIQENVIICEYTGLEYLENRIYTDIDMKLMNMSNQNILYFH